MNQAISVRSMVVVVLAAASLVAGQSVVLADEDDGFFKRFWGRGSEQVAPAAHPLYREECGSCHMAYPPGFLPPQSWEKMMSGLDDHFGENAELPEADRVEILNYLLDNAAGRSDTRLGNKMIRNLQGTPLRITKLPYFRHEHRELPRRMVEDNPKVRSLSQCDACHRDADKGRFDEHGVIIPGFGRYDD